MSETKENSREREAEVLFYVDGLLKFIADKDMTFEDALIQNMVQLMDDDYCQMAYKTIKTLHDKGYIEGDVSLDYEPDYPNINPEMDFESDDMPLSDRIDYEMCTFKNIGITQKGRKMLETDERILELKHLVKEMKDSVAKGGKKVLEEGKKVIPAIASAAIVEAINKLI